MVQKVSGKVQEGPRSPPDPIKKMIFSGDLIFFNIFFQLPIELPSVLPIVLPIVLPSELPIVLPIV